MRFSIAATIAALSATVLAQGNLANIPACAQNCFSSSDIGDCTSILDIACICKSSAITGISCCALAACDAADINSTITFATTLCSGEGVKLDTNPNCSASNSSSSASASASASSAASASSSVSVTAISGTNTPSGSATRSSSDAASSPSASATAATGAGAFQTAGPVLGLGVAIVGMLAAL